MQTSKYLTHHWGPPWFQQEALPFWRRSGARLGLGLGVWLALVLGTLPARAQDAVIGYVKTVQPDAAIVIAGKSTAAQPGMALQAGYLLMTGPRGSMGVTFRDNTVMSLGPDTHLVVDEYLYAPAKGDLKLGATLTRGTLQYISGIVAKLKPDAVTVKTPVGIIGVRGTRFLAQVDGKNP